ncbi:phosphoglucosamine mutase [Candidatus Dependentiae bacterium]|nr:phosphoglucosamine mutase [Candidatus Dependentiae bacterium]
MKQTTTTDRTILFGTDGIRGHADHFPFDDYTVMRIGYAIALWAREKYAAEQPKLLIGMDTRISGPRIKQALADGLLKAGAVVVDGGVIPTPAVCNLITADKSFHAGVVISASHNPYFDNGIKVFDAQRCKLSKEDEERLVAVVNSGPLSHLFKAPFEELSKSGADIIEWPEAFSQYINNVLSHFPTPFLHGKKIIIDAANGATGICAEIMFKTLGATVVMLNNYPDGININAGCGALHPEGLQAAVSAQGADAGFAFDGDGDRIVAVSCDGSIKDGDDILFLLLSLPRYQPMDTLVGTVVSNQGLEVAIEQQGKRFVRTAVGDKYIAVAMEEANVLLGGENSGHVILRDYLLTGDGIFVAITLLQALTVSGNWEMRTFPKFPQTLVNIPVVQKKDLAQEPFASIIAAYQERLGSGRLLVRYSGTESLLRVMAEATTADCAQSVAQAVALALQEVLGSHS